MLVQALPAIADDVITNIMSPIASYQYPNDFTSEVLTNGGMLSPIVSFQYLENFSTVALTDGGIMSPIASYQYYEWPGNGILNLQCSPVVSYYYQFLDAPPLTIISTNRTPTTAEITPLLAALPTTSQLLIYYNGTFTANLSPIDPNRPTVVLTHGWIPTTKGIPVFTPNGVADWPTTMAAQLRANGVFTGNILAWDWSYVAHSDKTTPGIPEQQTGDQGQILGEKLLLALGANYSHRIQFIGHSLGTLVNGYAANYLQGANWASENVSPSPWPATNMLMTLFDEAEVSRGLTSIWADIDLLLGRNGNPFTPSKAYDHPLPKQFAWAENYVAAVGLLQINAANVILTDNFPANAPDLTLWLDEFAAFHGYPINWYNETIQTDNAAMGFVWPFLWSLGDAGFANAPSTAGSVYVQDGSEYNLTATSWNYGTNLLAARYNKYLAYALASGFPDSAAVNGNGNGQYVVGAYPAFESAIKGIIFWLLTTPANASSASQFRAQPLDSPSGGSANNVPAYAWLPLFVPTNAVSMSFDYVIQGDWQSDTLTAAFNGTNVLSLPGSQIQTNMMFNSGQIDVLAYIVGGTSTNAQLTLENLEFSVSLPPILQVQASGGNLVLSWPMSAQNFSLQTTTNLADPNSWTILTNPPAIINSQNAVTNPISDTVRFYWLIRQ